MKHLNRSLCFDVEQFSGLMLSHKKQTVYTAMPPFFRYLLLVLMEAERAWSYAMQLKQEANTEPRKRFHLLSRLRKAAKHSEKLEKLCESPRVDAKTKLEAQVHRSNSS